MHLYKSHKASYPDAGCAACVVARRDKLHDVESRKCTAAPECRYDDLLCSANGKNPIHLQYAFDILAGKSWSALCESDTGTRHSTLSVACVFVSASQWFR